MHRIARSAPGGPGPGCAVRVSYILVCRRHRSPLSRQGFPCVLCCALRYVSSLSSVPMYVMYICLLHGAFTVWTLVSLFVTEQKTK
jgi:hypothetical protein